MRIGDIESHDQAVVWHNYLPRLGQSLLTRAVAVKAAQNV
jgi:hypothetical protein